MGTPANQPAFVWPPLAAAIMAAVAGSAQARRGAAAADQAVPPTLAEAPFGVEFPLLDGWAPGPWWKEARSAASDGHHGVPRFAAIRSSRPEEFPGWPVRVPLPAGPAPDPRAGHPPRGSGR